MRMRALMQCLFFGRARHRRRCLDLKENSLFFYDPLSKRIRVLRLHFLENVFYNTFIKKENVGGAKNLPACKTSNFLFKSSHTNIIIKIPALKLQQCCESGSVSIRFILDFRICYNETDPSGLIKNHPKISEK